MKDDALCICASIPYGRRSGLPAASARNRKPLVGPLAAVVVGVPAGAVTGAMYRWMPAAPRPSCRTAPGSIAPGAHDFSFAAHVRAISTTAGGASPGCGGRRSTSSSAGSVSFGPPPGSGPPSPSTASAAVAATSRPTAVTVATVSCARSQASARLTRWRTAASELPCSRAMSA